MHKLIVSILVAAVLTFGTHFPDDFEKERASFRFKSEISSISIKFPGEPTSELENQGETKIESVTFEADRQIYELVIFRPESKEAMELDMSQIGTRIDVADRMISAFVASKKGYSQDIVKGDWRFKKFDGKEVFFYAPSQRYKYRTMVLDDIAFTLTVSAYVQPMGKSFYDEKKADAFFKSIRMK